VVNPHRLNHVVAAQEEAVRLGATFTLENGRHHYIGVIAFNGKVRKTALSRTPSDHRVAHKVKVIVRRYIEEMRSNANGN
jgi:hypothetical protein